MNQPIQIQRQLIIHPTDLYEINAIFYFKCTIGNCTYHDIPCDLTKLNVYMLKKIYKYCCCTNTCKLKKMNLIQFIYDNNCIIFT